ncbi:MAG: peptidase [Planctomycetota bacterium]|nr:MAG: peptidase [Planctomycetota bacterium]
MSSIFRNLLAATLLFTVGFSGNAQAAAPKLNDILPHGVQRGTEVDLELKGANLEDAQELLVYDPGLTVISLTVPEDAKGGTVKVRVKAEPGAAIGSFRCRLRTATGLTNLQNIYVGPNPIVEEVEPNSEFTTPQAIANNTCVHGRVTGEDVDYYIVDCKKGERLTAEAYGIRLGFSSWGNFFDPYVAILNAARFEQSTSDDAALAWNDGVASCVIPEDGKYVVQIRDASYLGDGKAYYMLSIGTNPRPKGIIPAGGKPGETVKVKFLGDVVGDFEQDLVIPANAPSDWSFDVADAGGISPSPMRFRVSPLNNVLEVDNNDATAALTPVEAPAAFNGILEKPGDQDYFKFTAKKGQVFDVEMYGRRLRSSIDAVLYVCNKDGGGIASNDDSRGPDSYIRWTCPADGEYSILVHDHLRGGGPSYHYRVEMQPVEPKTFASTVEFQRYVAPQLVVPQGGGVGVQVNVTRQDYGGPASFKSDDLPAGVSIECPAMWRGGATMPVVLYAAADAPLAGKYSRITTFLEDPNQPNLKVEGAFQQSILMVLGPNQQTVWKEEQTRLPVVVTQPAPFKVRIEPPKVPMVRGGSLNLKVIAERVGDFKAPIQVLFLQNPPGVSSSGSISIPEGQNEASIPVNCNGNAPVGDWPIALRCIATVGNGPVESCTPFVPIRIEEQYMTLEFAQAAVEQGKEVPMFVKVTKRKDFEGEAVATLVGLPANSTAETVKVTKDTTEFSFTIKAAANTPPGNNQNLFAQILIPENGDMVVHNLGTGRLRVDTPPPPKPNEPAPMPTPMPMPEPMPVAAAAPPPKPLSRLEMLRLQQKEKAAAQAAKP